MVPPALPPPSAVAATAAAAIAAATTAPIATRRLFMLPLLPRRTGSSILRPARTALKRARTPPFVALPGGPAAVDEDALTVDVASRVRGEEDGERGDVLGEADASIRRAVEIHLLVLGVPQQ